MKPIIMQKAKGISKMWPMNCNRFKVNCPGAGEFWFKQDTRSLLTLNIFKCSKWSHSCQINFAKTKPY